MKWLREHGLVATYADRGVLPLGVYEDAALLMEAESQHIRAEAARAKDAANRANRAGVSRGFRR